MDSLRSMNNALAYIEEHLTEEIDYSEVSKYDYEIVFKPKSIIPYKIEVEK